MLSMKLKVVALAFLFLHALCFARTDGGLKLNYSEVDISTYADEHCVLAGFAARSGLSEGVHHNIYSRCLVFTDGEQKVCIISNDLMELSPSISYEMRGRIAKASGIPIQNVLMHCIHTHSTPRSGGRHLSLEAVITIGKYGWWIESFQMPLKLSVTTRRSGPSASKSAGE